MCPLRSGSGSQSESHSTRIPWSTIHPCRNRSRCGRTRARTGSGESPTRRPPRSHRGTRRRPCSRHRSNIDRRCTRCESSKRKDCRRRPGSPGPPRRRSSHRQLQARRSHCSPGTRWPPRDGPEGRRRPCSRATRSRRIRRRARRAREERPPNDRRSMLYHRGPRGRARSSSDSTRKSASRAAHGRLQAALTHQSGSPLSPSIKLAELKRGNRAAGGSPSAGTSITRSSREAERLHVGIVVIEVGSKTVAIRRPVPGSKIFSVAAEREIRGVRPDLSHSGNVMSLRLAPAPHVWSVASAPGIDVEPY